MTSVFLKVEKQIFLYRTLLPHMETITNSSMYFLFLLLSVFTSNTHLCFAVHTLSAGQSLYHNHTLVSPQGNFELGFFKPGKASYYYVGIWYKKISVLNRTVVWVANRDDPLTDPSISELKLLENGNLVIFNQSKIRIWSTNSTSNAMNLSELVLEDNGNLVLRDRSDPSVVFWQSFDHPTDTWLPDGKLRYDNRTKLPTLLTSWKNSENPAQGIFNLELDPIAKSYSVLWNRSTRYWTSGTWDGQMFSLVPEMKLNHVYNFSYVSNENESYFTYSVLYKSMLSRFVMNSSGQIMTLTWIDNTQSWYLAWVKPRQRCNVYTCCGAFSTCNQEGFPFCQCFPGFKPRSPRDWNLSDYSGGCVRKISLQCGDKDGFWIISKVKFSEKMLSSLSKSSENTKSLTVASDQECKLACLNECSCNAYYTDGSRCLIWNGDLLNIIQLSADDTEGKQLHLRLATSELEKLNDKERNVMVKNGDHTGRKMIIIIILVLVRVLIVGVLIGFACTWMAKQRGKRKKDTENFMFRKNDISESSGLCGFSNNQDVPNFNFEKLAIATNNFDSANKLGEGGFGPVYKGKLSDGREIAVKRLSKSSAQGLVEFKNEVAVISKLQHRNLVRLLGCCILGEEKILIYEYMPNKSLDSFIFDSINKALLDWRMRYEIIMGICQGMIYLHRDSRLRVVHRDLKASNILLDHNLKPKISDFGMARIFGGDQLQSNTKRVVGTYGYMSPEYAMEGVFSEKSDVYSFGVLLLELVSGHRNTSFYHHESSCSLLEYAWKLWSEGNTEELIDTIFSGSIFHEEILRCIHVGLLCVQDFAKDRPTMPSVVSMLNSKTSNLASPKQLSFTGRQVASASDLSHENCNTSSENCDSFMIIEGR